LTIFGIVIFIGLIVGMVLVTSYYWIFGFVLIPLLGAIWHCIKSKSQSYDDEIKIDRHSRIGKIITELSHHSKIKKPDHLYISEGSEIAVFGFRKKKMVIGLASLRFMNDEEIKAILAHEYGHYLNNDTIWGFLTARIQYFLEVIEHVSKESIDGIYSALVYIPTYAIFFLLNRYYHLVSMWHSRKKEYDADQFAASIVGEKTFAKALVKYSIVADLFGTYAPAYVKELLKEDQQFVNIYNFLGDVYEEKDIPKIYHNIMKEKSSFKDSHPSISERMEVLNIKNLPLSFKFHKDHLFSEQEKMEEKASNRLTTNIAYWEAVAYNPDLE